MSKEKSSLTKEGKPVRAVVEIKGGEMHGRSLLQKPTDAFTYAHDGLRGTVVVLLCRVLSTLNPLGS
jgi:hypothetical protein